MGVSAHSALSGAVLPADLRPLRTCSVGLSILLLVSIFMGDCDFGFAGDRLPQTEDLATNKERLAGIAGAALPPGRERDDAPTAFQRVALQVGLSLRIVVRKLWFGEPIDRSALTHWQ